MWAGKFSGVKNLLWIRWRSRKARASSDMRAARASVGLAAKRRGTGPLATSPLKSEADRGHSAAHQVATVSLHRDFERLGSVHSWMRRPDTVVCSDLDLVGFFNYGIQT